MIETVRTTDPSVRVAKLEIYKQLTGTVAPMNSPVELLRMIARAYRDGTGNIQAGSQHAYHLLENPAAATEELRQEFSEWANDQEARFKGLHERMRVRFDEPFDADAEERLGTETKFLDFVFETAEETLARMVTGFYRDATGHELLTAEVGTFLNAAVPWKIFIAAHLHALWVRAVKPKGPGKRSAGVVDTDSAVYLNFCDRFITNDHAQAETLRVANRFNPRVTAVELYPDLRSQLMV